MATAGEWLRGSCLCGGVRYEVRGPLGGIARCHCRECRKASGAEFATNAGVEAGDFHVVAGQELLRGYESSPGQERVFCSRCGSPLFKRRNDAPGQVRIRLGCVDTPVSGPVRIRVFTAEKLALTGIPDDGVPTFERLPGD